MQLNRNRHFEAQVGGDIVCKEIYWFYKIGDDINESVFCKLVLSKSVICYVIFIFLFSSFSFHSASFYVKYFGNISRHGECNYWKCRKGDITFLLRRISYKIGGYSEGKAMLFCWNKLAQCLLLRVRPRIVGSCQIWRRSVLFDKMIRARRRRFKFNRDGGFFFFMFNKKTSLRTWFRIFFLPAFRFQKCN